MLQQRDNTLRTVSYTHLDVYKRQIHKNEKKIECLDYLVCQMEKKMGKKIVVLSTSPRMGGNSEMMADAFIRGAAEAGHEAEDVYKRQGMKGWEKRWDRPSEKKRRLRA